MSAEDAARADWDGQFAHDLGITAQLVQEQNERLIKHALRDGLHFAVQTLAFHGRDLGTDRQERMLNDLEKMACDVDTKIRAALAVISARDLG